MPLLPLGLGKKTLDRIRQRLEQEVSPIYDRIKDELGMNAPKGPGGPGEPGSPGGPQPPGGEPTAEPVAPAPKKLPVARTPGAIEVMLREAVNSNPPRMVRALYRRENAKTATWRYLIPVEMVAGRAKDSSRPMLYAGCEADAWKVEAFRLDRFDEMQLTDLPFAVKLPYDTKPETF